MTANKYKILTQGQLPNSAGGLYNPGVLKFGEERMILVRHEKDYNFTNDVGATMVIGKIDELKNGAEPTVYYLKKTGFPLNSRIEDHRLFRYNDDLYSCHTLVVDWNGSSNVEPRLITPVISKISHQEIRFFDWLELPIKQKRVEKNWQMFTWKDDLYCLYSLDPLIIFKLVGFSWKAIKEEENGLIDLVKKSLPGCGYLSLSAVTLWGDQFVLGFWHTYVGNIIHQGAFILDMNALDITEFTPTLLDGTEWNDGFKKGICYVSGLIVNDEVIEVWCGEADSHTCLLEMPKNELTNILINSPFKKKAPLKIAFRDAGLGDYICAMYAIQGWLNENPDEVVYLYLKMQSHLELSCVLKMNRVRTYYYTDQKYSIDLTSNENETEYREKLKYPYKEWYGFKIGSKPAAPDISHIQSKEGYEGCIILCPFAMWDNRTWDFKYWCLLSEILVQKGYKVVVEAMDEKTVKGMKGEFFCGRSIMDNFRLTKAAALVISNDSGAAHVAGLLDTPCIVLSGWLNPENVFSNTNVSYIWNQDTKHPEHNLNLITVDSVLIKMKEMGL